MDLQAKTKDDVQIVSLSGRFDAFEVPQLTTWLEANIAAGQANVVLDLGGVEFIDSSGLAALVKVMKRCREHSGDVVLCNLQQAVTIILELTNLNRAFNIQPTQADALKVFE